MNKPNMPASYLIHSLLLCLSLPLPGQHLPRILNHSRAGHAARDQNWAIAQNAGGVLFFASNEGLLEYDGARWNTFSLPNKQTMRAVACAGGRVYVGGFAEFGYFEADSLLKWRYHSLSQHLQSDLVRREEIWHILIREESQEVFFQSFSTIYEFDGKKTAQISPPANIMFLEKANDGIYFQGIGAGLYELLKDGGFRFVSGSEILSNTIVSFILPAKNGGLLAGTKNEGIFQCAGGKCLPWANPLNERLKSFQPNKAVLLQDGGLAIGTVLNGVFILDSLENLRYHLSRENGLQNNTVLSMLTGHSGNLWLGLDKGIDLVELNSPLVWFTDQTGKIGTVYTAALFEGKLYLGSNQGVFFREWEKGDDPNGKKEEFQLVPGTQGQVWQLKVFDNQLLCGHNEGTFLIKNGTARKISGLTGGWVTLPIPGKNDLLLQGTYTGLALFNKNRNGDWALSHRVQGFGDPVIDMAFANDGTLWLVHPNRGMWRIRLNEDRKNIAEIRRFTQDDGLPTDFRLYLYQHDDRLLIQADTSFFLVKNERLIPHPPLEPDSKIFNFPAGTFTVLPSSVVFNAHNTRVEFPVNLVPGNENIIQVGTNHFLFCLENGYALWDKNSPSSYENKEENKLAISAVEVLSEPPHWVYPRPGRSDGLWETPANRNNLRFYFTQPYFTQKVPVLWVLNGPDKRSAKSESGFVEITGLPPGNYSLEISTMEGVPGDRFNFKVLPPWWQTWWAVAVWILLAASGIWLVEKYNHRRLRRQREHLQKEKERELAAQRTEAEKERLQAEVDNKNRELSNATINLIRKNEILLALKSELGKTELPRHDQNRLDRLIENHLSGDKDWELFEEAFNQVHDVFFKKLKNQFPQLTPGDLRLAAFLKLNLSSKEIASLLGISVRGVENKRYRLRKKMELGEEENLAGFLMEV